MSARKPDEHISTLLIITVLYIQGNTSNLVLLEIVTMPKTGVLFTHSIDFPSQYSLPFKLQRSTKNNRNYRKKYK